MPREKLAVRRFTVHKQLSELFRIEILANSTNDDLNLEKFTGLSLDNILADWSSGVGIPVSPPLHPARGPATCSEPNHMSCRFLAGNTHSIV